VESESRDSQAMFKRTLSRDCCTVRSADGTECLAKNSWDIVDKELINDRLMIFIKIKLNE